MPSSFRTSDKNRVQMALDAALPSPYEAIVTLEDGRRTIKAIVPDPDNDTLTVTQASWAFEAGLSTQMQPSESDLNYTVARMAVHCGNYTPPE